MNSNERASRIFKENPDLTSFHLALLNLIIKQKIDVSQALELAKASISKEDPDHINKSDKYEDAANDIEGWLAKLS